MPKVKLSLMSCNLSWPMTQIQSSFHKLWNATNRCNTKKNVWFTWGNVKLVDREYYHNIFWCITSYGHSYIHVFMKPNLNFILKDIYNCFTDIMFNNKKWKKSILHSNHNYKLFIPFWWQNKSTCGSILQSVSLFVPFCK